MKIFTILLKKVFLFSFLIGISLFSTAQGTFKLTDLQGKNWYMKGLADNQTTEEKYENDRITTIIGGSLIFNSEYYLSDVVEKDFDSTKIGQVKEGRFIIRRPVRSKSKPNQPLSISVFEIIELSSTKLVYKSYSQSIYSEFITK